MALKPETTSKGRSRGNRIIRSGIRNPLTNIGTVNYPFNQAEPRDKAPHTRFLCASLGCSRHLALPRRHPYTRATVRAVPRPRGVERREADRSARLAPPPEEAVGRHVGGHRLKLTRRIYQIGKAGEDGHLRRWTWCPVGEDGVKHLAQCEVMHALARNHPHCRRHLVALVTGHRRSPSPRRELAARAVPRIAQRVAHQPLAVAVIFANGLAVRREPPAVPACHFGSRLLLVFGDAPPPAFTAGTLVGYCQPVPRGSAAHSSTTLAPQYGQYRA